MNNKQYQRREEYKINLNRKKTHRYIWDFSYYDLAQKIEIISAAMATEWREMEVSLKL